MMWVSSGCRISACLILPVGAGGTDDQPMSARVDEGRLWDRCAERQRAQAPGRPPWGGEAEWMLTRGLTPSSGRCCARSWCLRTERMAQSERRRR